MRSLSEKKKGLIKRTYKLKARYDQKPRGGQKKSLFKITSIVVTVPLACVFGS